LLPIFLPKLPTSIFFQGWHYLSLICDATSGTDIENQELWLTVMALILIIIVLISNLLANALRKYYGKKVKMN
jgi:phosphate transport system permease protein